MAASEDGNIIGRAAAQASPPSRTAAIIFIGRAGASPPSYVVVQLRLFFYIIGRAGASPPSRTTGPRCLYIYIYVYIYVYIRSTGTYTVNF